MKKIKYVFKLAFEKRILRRAAKVALLVGVLLNLINQGEHILSLSFGSVHLVKLILTFIVPYLVSTYTAVALHLSFKPGTVSLIPVNLECLNCKNENISLEENQVVPECSNCSEKSKWSLK